LVVHNLPPQLLWRAATLGLSLLPEGTNTMTEYNTKEDRVSATNWHQWDSALRELDALSFAVSAIVSQFPSGSNELENGHNAWLGIRHRIDHLHDSLRRLRKEPTP
jgi:hypothetical protein